MIPQNPSFHFERALKRWHCGILLLAIAVFPLSPLATAETPCPSTVPTMQDGWVAINDIMAADAKARANEIKIVFAGDSISARWTSGAGREIYAQRYAPQGAINLSISADSAQNLLWRLQHGVLDHMRPKMVILLIGANNLGDTPEAVAYAVWANVAHIRKTLPDTRVLVQGIFERENPLSDAGKAAVVNAILARLDDGKMVKFLDFSRKFLKPDGTLDKAVFPDLCHPEKPEGFQIWADSIQPVIDEWLKAPPVPNVPPPPSPVGEAKDPKWGEPVKRNDFLFRHNRYVDRASKGKCDLLFIGDTSMACWDRLEPLVKAEYGQFHYLNFAIGGSRTENILWQLSNGELNGIQPKLVVVQVQENLYDKTTPYEDVAAGMNAIAKMVREKLPEAKVLLVGAFPKGEKPTDPLRVKIANYNCTLARYADGKSVYYLDASHGFVGPDGIVGKDAPNTPGQDHYNPKSYELWAENQRATITELMGASAAPH